MRPRRNSQMFRNRLADIGIGLTDADGTGSNARPVSHDGHALACVIRATPRRIAAVIGGQDDEIARLQFLVHFRQPRVERLECCGISRHVAAVTIDHVEIDEIGENQIAILGFVHGLQRRIHQRHVAVGLDDPGNALMGEDIADLADGMHRALCLDETIEQRRLRRQHGEIAAVSGPLEGRCGLADERAGNDAADIVRIEQERTILQRPISRSSPKCCSCAAIWKTGRTTYSRSACRYGCALRQAWR